MVKRYLLFFALLTLPVLGGAVRRPLWLCFLPGSAAGAWWAVSPVSYARWILRGLARALPLAAAEILAVWWLSR